MFCLISFTTVEHFNLLKTTILDIFISRVTGLISENFQVMAKRNHFFRNQLDMSFATFFFEENYFFLTTQRVKFCVIRFRRSSKHFKICIFIDGTAKDKTWCKGESDAVDWDGTSCRVFWCGSSQVLPWNHFSSKSFRLNHRAEVFCAIGNHIHFSSYGVIFFVVHLTSFDCPSGSLRDKVNFFCCSND